MSQAAPCCIKALQDATQRWPNRNRASDGIMGDPAHRARKSDHNTGDAFDLTHDPANGVDCGKLSRDVTADARAKYVIWNREIWSRSKAAQGWRAYNGANPHTKHMHVSIIAAQRTSMLPWPWTIVRPTP